jgi:chondroitin 4-sulfotransferase 11
MAIDHKNKFIFIHIPKTAGTAIEEALGFNVEKLHKKKYNIKHGTPTDDKYVDYWDEYFTFTCVRNPWDRFVSLYFFELEYELHNRAASKRRKLIKKLGPEGFLQYTKEYHHTFDNSYHNHGNQINWFEEKYKYNYVMRYENLESDFNIICQKLNLKDVKLKHINKSQHKHYIEYYDQESINIVYKQYLKDIKYFNYKFK